MQMYDWGVFWETGDRASLPVPFGPEHPEDNVIGLNSPWVEQIMVYMPNFIEAMDELPFAMIIVNPPREATQAEVEYWKEKGYHES
jgi:hypothetical protein